MCLRATDGINDRKQVTNQAFVRGLDQGISFPESAFLVVVELCSQTDPAIPVDFSIGLIFCLSGRLGLLVLLLRRNFLRALLSQSFFLRFFFFAQCSLFLHFALTHSTNYLLSVLPSSTVSVRPAIYRSNGTILL